MNNLHELIRKHDAEGERFAKDLGQFVERTAPARDFVFVETGYGASTLWILDAMSRLGRGHLYSIDPAPWFPDLVSHPRHTLIRDKSYDAVTPLRKKAPLWDYFLHDSNHDVECMTFELAYADFAVPAGGIILCDDYTWNDHGAWQEFCRRSNAQPSGLGSLQWIRRTPTPHDARSIEQQFTISQTQAQVAAQAFYARGGKDSGVFV